MNMPANTVPSERALTRTVPFEFRGRAGEYFGIWIVNLLLTIVTVGIYSAWAKVRRLRYFYGNTYLDGHNFEYHARPMQILIGRLIVVGVLIVVNLLINFVSPFFAALLVPYLLAFPWLLNKAIAFNARMTTWRNVRLSFSGTYWGAFGVFVAMPIVASITIGLLAPLASRMAADYIGRNLKLGTASFHTSASTGDMYRNFGMTILFTLGAAIGLGLLLAIIGAVGFMGAQSISGGGSAESMTLGGTIGGFAGAYMAVLLAFGFYAAGVRNVAFNGTVLEGGHRFVSTLGRVRYAWILATNLIVSLLTLTLMWPWAAIRTWRYLADNTAVVTSGSLDSFIDQQAAAGAVTAAEFFDIEGIDFGL